MPTPWARDAMDIAIAFTAKTNEISYFLMRHFMAIEFLNERHLKKSQISLISWREKPGGNLLALDSRKLKGQFVVVPLKAFHSVTIQGLPCRN